MRWSVRLEGASASPLTGGTAPRGSESQSLLGWLVELVTELGRVISAAGLPVLTNMSDVRSAVISPAPADTCGSETNNTDVKKNVKNMLRTLKTLKRDENLKKCKKNVFLHLWRANRMRATLKYSANVFWQMNAEKRTKNVHQKRPEITNFGND